MWELTKSFRFEAAHALPGTTLGAASEAIHGRNKNGLLRRLRSSQ